MNSYNEELRYRVELFEALSGQLEAVQLAQQLLEYGKPEADRVVTDQQDRLEVIRYLASDIEKDGWRLERFREAYLFRILSMSDDERMPVDDAIRELCATHLPFLEKSLGFQLAEMQAIYARLRRNPNYLTLQSGTVLREDQ